MKNVLSLVMLALAAIPVSAQHGFFVQPGVGLGATSKTFTSGGISYPNNFRFSYSAQVSAGYEYKRLVVSSGIGYLKTGYKASEPLKRFDVKGYYSHVVVPVIVGWRIGKEGFTVTPQGGIYIAYNYASNVTFWSYSDIGKTVDVRATGRAFRAGYESFAVLGTVQAKLEKKVNARMSIVCTPGVVASLTNMIAHTRGYPGPIQRNYGGVVELGVKWNLGSNHKESNVASE